MGLRCLCRFFGGRFESVKLSDSFTLSGKRGFLGLFLCKCLIVKGSNPMGDSKDGGAVEVRRETLQKPESMSCVVWGGLVFVMLLFATGYEDLVCACWPWHESSSSGFVV